MYACANITLLSFTSNAIYRSFVCVTSRACCKPRLSVCVFYVFILVRVFVSGGAAEQRRDALSTHAGRFGRRRLLCTCVRFPHSSSSTWCVVRRVESARTKMPLVWGGVRSLNRWFHTVEMERDVGWRFRGGKTGSKESAMLQS